MDKHIPGDEDNLNDFERRLAGWRPTVEGLDAHAMLFAAGHAAGQRGRARLLWPALCVVLAVQVAGLSMWGLSERAERQALASQLRERPPARNTPAETLDTVLPESAYTPSPEDYLHLRQRMEQDPSRLLLSFSPTGSQPLEPPPPNPPILRAGQRDGQLD
jgi:hypothetical protein